MFWKNLLAVALPLFTLPATTFASTTLVEPPRAVVAPAPEYPEQARDLGVEGVVLVQVELEKTGKKARIWVDDPNAHPVLQQAAVDSVRQWRFAPALEDGEPVSSQVTVPIRFEIVADRPDARSGLGPASLKALW